MRQRMTALIIGACLLVPCLLVVHESAKTDDIRAEMSELKQATAEAPAGFDALRQVTRLRSQLSAVETEIACERLRELPSDALEWHTSLIVQPDWQTRPAEKMAMTVLDREPHLKALKAQTKFHLLTTDNALYQRNFAKACPLTPCLLITRADGTVIYKESGAQLGAHPRSLYSAVRAEIRRNCPDGRCLPPLRFPDTNPDATPHRELVPDSQREEQAPADDGDVLPLVGCFLVGCAVVFYVVIKKDLS